MYIGRPACDVDPDLPDYPTLLHALRDTARRIPDRAAILCGDRGLTYAEYERAVAGYARLLDSRSVRGRRIAILMKSSIEAAVVALAGMAAGAQVALLNQNFPVPALLPLLHDLDPVLVVTDTAAESTARAAAGQAGLAAVDVFGPGGLSVDDWATDPGLGLDGPLPAPEDPSILFFTGGTTGLPKGALHTHSSMMAFCRSSNTMWRTELDAEVFLNVAPMFHVWGFCHAVNTPIFMGGTIDIVSDYKPEIILERFESSRVTVFSGGPPALYVGLRANERFRRTDFSRLRYSLSGGAPCSEDLLRGWEADTGCMLLEGIGMSEGAPITANPTWGTRKILSVGLPAPECEITIVDLETGETVLDQGERGEIRVRGPQFIKGYLNRPEETAEAIRGGWLHTGDIGYFDEDGYLFVVDRKKEMILVGGYNVYPREVDEILTSHPAVLEAAAIGAPDSFRGETVKACVALVPGATATPDELIAWCSERLVKYKVPTIVEIRDSLPKTGAGKIDKLALKGER